MYLKDNPGNGVNPRAKDTVDSNGFVVERFRGQTIIYMPLESTLQIGRADLSRVVQEIFSEYEIGDDLGIYFCQDGISMMLPSVRRVKDDSLYHLSNEKIKEMMDEDPTQVFPDFYLPDDLVKKIYEMSAINNKPLNLQSA